MMELLASLEASALSVWIKESATIWSYPTILTLHTVGLALLVGANWAFALRVLGFADAIPLQTLRWTFTWMWIGFWINFASGVLLFMADATTKGATRLFLTKIGLVVCGVVIVVMTRRSVFGAGDRPPVVGPGARGLAAASLVTWVAAIVAGRWMAYI